MHRVSGFFSQFSFSRKLALTFFVCSLVTFLVIDVIMNVLYSTVMTTSNTDSTFNSQAFSEFSNNQILSSSTAYLQAGLNLYEQIVTQTFTTWDRFRNNSDLYTSNQIKGINPLECSNFNTTLYEQTCMYFYTNTSTFYDEPYIDKVISSSISEHYPTGMKRINVIYQSKTDPTDISVRTLPATSDFYIPNTTVVSSRINTTYPGIIIFTDWYLDQMSKKSNTTQLISLRLFVQRDDCYMIVQAEIYKAIMNTALNNVFSFPNTLLFLLKMTDTSSSKFSIIGQNEYLPATINLSKFLNIGSVNVTLNNTNFLVTTKQISDDGSQLVDTLLTTIPSSNLRMIIFLNTSETMLPNTVYDVFRENQYSALVFLLYGWTLVVMVVVFSIGIVIGDIIFSYFKLIGEKCKQYRKNPQAVQQINKDIRYGSQVSQAKNQLLIKNIVSIMQGIENKKHENKMNYRISYDSYPLNRLGIGFQSRMKLKDYNKFEVIAQIIKERQSS